MSKVFLQRYEVCYLGTEKGRDTILLLCRGYASATFVRGVYFWDLDHHIGMEHIDDAG